MPCPEHGTVWTLNTFCFLPPAPGKPGLQVCTQETHPGLNVPQKAQVPPCLEPALLRRSITQRGPWAALAKGLAIVPNDLILRITVPCNLLFPAGLSNQSSLSPQSSPEPSPATAPGVLHFLIPLPSLQG